MEYAVGKTGRIIGARLFEGEDLYECVEEIAKKENIKSAAVLITGGFRKASVVVGPKQEKPKILGNFKEFAGPGETLGVGTIYCDERKTKTPHPHCYRQRQTDNGRLPTRRCKNFPDYGSYNNRNHRP